ncbi:MAG TPA: response regulator [Candidatus Dormibacteraeota bacterium]|nr:response regulator [Candidatus Dormibacteraeota bacterium]
MKKRILLVEDDSAVRRMLSRILADEDYTVIPASDQREALKTAAAKGADLVVLDLSLPAHESQEALNRFAQEHPDLPVIVTTGSHHPPAVPGARSLMEKPLDFAKLLRTIQSLLAPA